MKIKFEVVEQKYFLKLMIIKRTYKDFSIEKLF